MIVSEKAVTRAIAHIENSHHRVGWDNTGPTLYVLTSRARQVYPGEPLALPRGGGTPGNTLAELALIGANVYDRYPGPNLVDFAHEGFAGFAFACEAWMRRDVTPEELAAFEAGEMPALADQVGSVEVRFAFAVDTSGRHLAVSRVRGEPPKINLGHGAWLPEHMQWDGLIPLSLELLTAAVCQRLGERHHEIPDIDNRIKEVIDLLLTTGRRGRPDVMGPD